MLFFKISLDLEKRNIGRNRMDFRWRVGATTSAQMAFSKATERKPKLAGLINWRARGARAYNGGQRTNPPAGPGAARVPNKRFRDASEASSLLTLRCPKEGQIVYNKKIIYRKQQIVCVTKIYCPESSPRWVGKSHIYRERTYNLEALVLTPRKLPRHGRPYKHTSSFFALLHVPSLIAFG